VTAAAFVERARAVGSRGRRWLLPLAVLAFVVTAAVAFGNLPEDLDLRWWPIVVSALVLSPLTTAANAGEFAATARVLGARVGAREALRVAVLSSAANLLPVPGAVAVRTHRLREAGGYRPAFRVTAAAGLCWLGVALAAAGAADGVANGRAAGAVPAAAGAACVVTAALVTRRTATTAEGRAAWWSVLAAEVGQVVVGAARLGLAVAALGYPVTVAQALGLAVAPVAASAIGVLPGGLGLREAIAATIGALVDLAAAVAGAAAALDRVVGLVVLAAVAPLARAGKRAAAVETPPEHPGRTQR